MFLCLILVGLASAAYFGVPARLGLVKPGVDKYFSPTPDRLAAADLKEELKKAGVNPQGMELYVLPVAGKQESVAYAVLDASQGFKFPAYQGRDPLIGYMNQLVSGETAKKNNITRVAIDYRSASGKPLMTMTSSTADLSGLLKGEISREEFMKRLDGRADWQALLEEGLQ